MPTIYSRHDTAAHAGRFFFPEEEGGSGQDLFDWTRLAGSQMRAGGVDTILLAGVSDNPTLQSGSGGLQSDAPMNPVKRWVSITVRLTPRGRDILRGLARRGILIDLSDASLAAVKQAVELIDRRMILSHSNIGRQGSTTHV